MRSRLLSEAGFAHAFSLRSGGISKGPYQSLNLRRSTGDDPAAIEENHRRFAAAVGYEPGALYELSQVHGAQIEEATRGEDPAGFRKQHGDGLVAREAGLAVGVGVADCVPVLMADQRTGAVAAAHAGWRGIVAGVVPAAIARLGGDVADLRVAIGPHLRACCFEVDEDVAHTIAAAAGDEGVVERRAPKPYVSMVRVLSLQLDRVGVVASLREDVGGCTRCDPTRFFSYRRDGAKSGRHLAAIVARAVSR